MKLKQIPADFHVEEITKAAPVGEGSYSLYKLEKKNWTTPDALALIRRRWKVPLSRISYGGLKDRHAETIQYLTIFHGPQRNFTHPGISVTHLGLRPEPYESNDIQANRFTLTLRSMSKKAIALALGSIKELEQVGVPNYFDEQRFGSVSFDGRFVAKEMVLGRYEQALKTALMSPYEHDRTAMKEEKSLLRDHWGDWALLKKKLEWGHPRMIVDYLAHHPDDFRGALERLKPELRGLYLSAWQSFLWNKMLALWLNENIPHGQLLTLRARLGDLPAPRTMSPDNREIWKSLMLPLPSARLKLDPEAPWAKLVEAVMEDEGLKLEQIKLKDFRKPFFSKGDRAAAVIPSGLTARDEADDKNPDKRKLILRFDLPRGCYATLIIKRLTQVKDS